MYLEAKRGAIVQALRESKGDIASAATLLGIGRTTVYRKMEELQIAPEEYGGRRPRGRIARLEERVTAIEALIATTLKVA